MSEQRVRDPDGGGGQMQIRDKLVREPESTIADRERAEAWLRSSPRSLRESLADAFAAARAVERERCARIAMGHAEWASEPGRFTVEEAKLIAGAGSAIAKEIRRG